MLTNHTGSFSKFEFKFLAGIVSSTWWAKIWKKIDFTVNNAVHLRSNPVAMPGESPWSSPSPLCPDPGRATWEEKEEAAWTPSLCPSSIYTMPTVVASPPPTHSAPTLRPKPSSTPPRPPRPASTMPVARPPPAQATYWTPSPPASWPIKSPAEHTSELTPLPASSQTPSLPPVRSRSQ
jgi:hypothetical protein